MPAIWFVKPRFVQSSNRRCFSNQLPSGVCWISEKMQDHRNLKPGTRWSIWDDSDTFAEQNQCDANKLGHAGLADSRTGEQRCHPRAKMKTCPTSSLCTHMTPSSKCLLQNELHIDSASLLPQILPISAPPPHFSPPPPPLCITECKLSH